MSGIILEMTVAGVPETKGSWVALPGGKMKRDNPREKGWANAIGWAARGQLRGKPPSSKRIRVDVLFRLPAPTGKRNQRDLDKLLRSCFDALQKIAFVDDELVDMVVAEKVVTPNGHGATISVREHEPSLRAAATSTRERELVIEALAYFISDRDCGHPDDLDKFTSAREILQRMRAA